MCIVKIKGYGSDSFLNCYLNFPGWYMAVESYNGDQMSPAALQSPAMKQASSTCTLHFYYNMYGEGMFCMMLMLVCTHSHVLASFMSELASACYH